MKVKTSELTGTALDWAVAKCEGLEVESIHPGCHVVVWKTCALTEDKEVTYAFKPSTDWAQGGPIIEREDIAIDPTFDCPKWSAFKANWNGRADGPTPLIAAMRCYVASELGDEVDVPNETIV